MDVRIKPETEARLRALTGQSGRAADELVEDALAGYLNEVSELRKVLDTRYNDYKNGKVSAVDGEAVFEKLQQRGQELLKRPPK